MNRSLCFPTIIVIKPTRSNNGNSIAKRYLNWMTLIWNSDSFSKEKETRSWHKYSHHVFIPPWTRAENNYMIPLYIYIFVVVSPSSIQYLNEQTKTKTISVQRAPCVRPWINNPMPLHTNLYAALFFQIKKLSITCCLFCFWHISEYVRQKNINR